MTSMKSVKEWIDEKINDKTIEYFEYKEFKEFSKTIEYFEYKEFSKVEEISRGGFGKVSRANLDCMGLEVALKRSIDENTTFEKDDIKGLDEIIKEVRITFFFKKKIYYCLNLN